MVLKDYEIKRCDILIIGGGGSGVIAAIEASSDKEVKILLVNRGPIGQSGLTPTGNGGTSASKSIEEMFKRAIIAGDFLNDQNIVWLMVNEIHPSLERLRSFGIPVFPMGERSMCVPGVEALSKLRKELKKRPNIELYEDVLVTSLIKKDDRVSWATALDITTGRFFVIKPKSIIIATGGASGELYPYSSNNPFGISTHASATGHIMAFLAGAELIDMEMVQFVPLPAEPRCLNLRYFPEFWKGPYMNRHGEILPSPSKYIGESYSPYFVQDIFRVLKSGDGPIYIDRRNRGPEDWDFPISSMMRRRRFIQTLGIDPSKNRIEITIGSHFCMGGIKVNERCETTIPGVYAAGEVMGGVHGGVRLPGYSFAQMIVFGFVAGREALRFAKENDWPKESSIQEILEEGKRVFGLLEDKKNPSSLKDLKKELQNIMVENVFVFRDGNGLKKAINNIKALKEKAARLSVPNFKRFNIEWVNGIEFFSTIQCAEIISESGLFREESRGFHYRNDFPNKGDVPKHTTARFDDGKINLFFSPVILNRMKPEV